MQYAVSKCAAMETAFTSPLSNQCYIYFILLETPGSVACQVARASQYLSMRKGSRCADISNICLTVDARMIGRQRMFHTFPEGSCSQDAFLPRSIRSIRCALPAGSTELL